MNEVNQMSINILYKSIASVLFHMDPPLCPLAQSIHQYLNTEGRVLAYLSIEAESGVVLFSGEYTVCRHLVALVDACPSGSCGSESRVKG